MHDRNEEASLSISGRSPIGESFDITIYFADPDYRLWQRRVDALVEATKAVGKGVMISGANSHTDQKEG